MSENHSFNTTFAKLYGIEESIIFNNLYHWCKVNKQNEVNLKTSEKEDEKTRKPRYWTYCSRKALLEQYDYMSSSKIYRVIKHLEEEGLIIIDSFNKISFDKTSWYAITEKGEKAIQSANADTKDSLYDCNKNETSIVQNEQPIAQNETVDDVKMNNEIVQNEPTIHDIINNISNDTNTDIKFPSEPFPKDPTKVKEEVAEESSSSKRTNYMQFKKSNTFLANYFSKITSEDKSIAETIVTTIENKVKTVSPKFHFAPNVKGNEEYEILEYARKNGVSLNSILNVLNAALKDNWWGNKIDSAKYLTNNYIKMAMKFSATTSSTPAKPQSGMDYLNQNYGDQF